MPSGAFHTGPLGAGDPAPDMAKAKQHLQDIEEVKKKCLYSSGSVDDSGADSIRPVKPLELLRALVHARTGMHHIRTSTRSCTRTAAV